MRVIVKNVHMRIWMNVILCLVTDYGIIYNNSSHPAGLLRIYHMPMLQQKNNVMCTALMYALVLQSLHLNTHAHRRVQRTAFDGAGGAFIFHHLQSLEEL